jgi:MFS superfamily sulfate permease-like transporter
LLAILVLKAHKRMGAILVAVIVATAVAGWFQLSQKYGVKVLGPVPQGLPKFSIPFVGVSDLVPILAGGFAVAIVAFADTSVLSRTFAARAGARVDPNQEMVGLGAANLAAGFFQGFAISSSSSRTPVAEAAGAKTQVTGVVGALIVAIVIIGAPMLFQNLPYSALAAVVIAAAIGLFEFGDLGRIYRIQQWEFWLSILCTAGVAVFGAIPGIGIAIAVAVIEFLWDGWRPHWAVLGKPEGVDGFHDVTRYPGASRVPGLVLFRWDAPLFFANAELFGERIHDAVSASPSPVHRVVVSAAPITSVDVTSADALTELAETLKTRGIELCFAELKDPVKDQLKRFGLFTQFGEGRFFPTIDSAVSAYVRDYKVNWPAE